MTAERVEEACRKLSSYSIVAMLVAWYLDNRIGVLVAWALTALFVMFRLEATRQISESEAET